jgi:nitroimidazol reductase NimA-like FMN-containing flavoprotein (pyridoxamine 5'-phosphate oxidase superfamily)
MDRESASRVLATPLAQELLRSSPLAHLAYIGRDGYPRVIPTGYVWKGGKFVVCSPDNAPKVRSLGSDPRVALTIVPVSLSASAMPSRCTGGQRQNEGVALCLPPRGNQM